MNLFLIATSRGTYYHLTSMDRPEEITFLREMYLTDRDCIYAVRPTNLNLLDGGIMPYELIVEAREN